MKQEKKPRKGLKQGLHELAYTHLKLGDVQTTTHQSLFNHLRDEGYEIERKDSDVDGYFSESPTVLKQSYELEKEGGTYELNIEKENGRMQKYWFEE